jgi:hypothetical protein
VDEGLVHRILNFQQERVMVSARWAIFFLVLLPSVVWAQDTTAPMVAITSPTDYMIQVTASDRAGNQTSAEIAVHKPKHDFRPPGCTLAENGAFFKVWAPHAQKVALIGDFNSCDQSDNLLWNQKGWWFGFEPGVVAGQKYRFAINGNLDRADPYGC